MFSEMKQFKSHHLTQKSYLLLELDQGAKHGVHKYHLVISHKSAGFQYNEIQIREAIYAFIKPSF